MGQQSHLVGRQLLEAGEEALDGLVPVGLPQVDGLGQHLPGPLVGRRNGDFLLLVHLVVLCDHGGSVADQLKIDVEDRLQPVVLVHEGTTEGNSGSQQFPRSERFAEIGAELFREGDGHFHLEIVGRRDGQAVFPGCVFQDACEVLRKAVGGNLPLVVDDNRLGLDRLAGQRQVGNDVAGIGEVVGHLNRAAGHEQGDTENKQDSDTFHNGLLGVGVVAVLAAISHSLQKLQEEK